MGIKLKLNMACCATFIYVGVDVLYISIFLIFHLPKKILKMKHDRFMLIRKISQDIGDLKPIITSVPPQRSCFMLQTPPSISFFVTTCF